MFKKSYKPFYLILENQKVARRVAVEAKTQEKI